MHMYCPSVGYSNHKFQSPWLLAGEECYFVFALLDGNRDLMSLAPSTLGRISSNLI